MKPLQIKTEIRRIKAPLTKRKIAKLLGVSEYILRKWLKTIKEKIGEPIGRSYCIKQVEQIVEEFGSLADFANPEHPKLIREQQEYNKLLEQKAEAIKSIKNDSTIYLRKFIV